MKAEKTRELIDKSIDMVFGWTKKSNKTLHDLCVSTDSELTELERLAEIGAKIEKVFKDNKVEGFLNATWDDGQISSYSGEFIGLEELLMFSEEEE